MAARTVVGPDGRTWKVRRKWLTRSVHWRGSFRLRPKEALDALDATDLLGVGGELPFVTWLLLAVAVFVFVAALLPLLVPVLLFLGELTFVLLAVVLGLLARVLLRRPWIVEARIVGTNEGRQWKVTGWRASGEQVETVAERIRSTGRVGDVTWTPSPTD